MAGKVQRVWKDVMAMARLLLRMADKSNGLWVMSLILVRYSVTEICYYDDIRLF